MNRKNFDLSEGKKRRNKNGEKHDIITLIR